LPHHYPTKTSRATLTPLGSHAGAACHDERDRYQQKNLKEQLRGWRHRQTSAYAIAVPQRNLLARFLNLPIWTCNDRPRYIRLGASVGFIVTFAAGFFAL
jgi:hypothetical protein